MDFSKRQSVFNRTPFHKILHIYTKPEYQKTIIWTSGLFFFWHHPLCPLFHPFFSLAREHQDCLRLSSHTYPAFLPAFFYLFIMYSTRQFSLEEEKKLARIYYGRPTITWARIMSAFTIVSRRRMFVFIAQSLAIIRIRRQNSEFSRQPRMWLRFDGEERERKITPWPTEDSRAAFNATFSHHLLYHPISSIVWLHKTLSSALHPTQHSLISFHTCTTLLPIHPFNSTVSLHLPHRPKYKHTFASLYSPSTRKSSWNLGEIFEQEFFLQLNFLFLSCG